MIICIDTMNNKYILPAVLLIAGLMAGFSGGYYFKTYQQNSLRNNFRNGSTGANGQRFMPGVNGTTSGSQNRGMMFGGAVEGDIISMDDKSVTVKLTDGSSKIILFSDQTIYSSNILAKKTDLKQDNKIMVFGKANTDGSITADRIQLNPINQQVIPTPKK